MKPTSATSVRIDYTNWRGERGWRNILPLRLYFGEVSWHPGPQWLLQAIDLDKGQERTFAMAQVHEWGA